MLEDKNEEAEIENREPEDRNREAQNENQEAELTLTHEVRTVRSYSGPIPPAEEFARYEDVFPGSANRLFSMAEREQDEIVSFRNKSLLATTVIAIATIIAIAHILTLNPNTFVLAALAISYALPPITGFLRGMSDNALAKKERELDIQIRKDVHEIDMKAARQQLMLPSSSDQDSSGRLRRLESDNESTDAEQGSLRSD